VTKKSKFKGPPAQWWSERLGGETPEELSTFQKWLVRDRWESAGELVRAFLKRFQKPPTAGRTEKPH
jgi:hypothetical protein